MPTYTDLYYSDPANLGNPNLKPESAWSFEAGPEWRPGGAVSAQITVFRRLDHEDIDYVKYSPAAPWQAMNIQNLTFTGLEGAVQLRMPRSQNIQVGYTGIHASQVPLLGLISKYVFEYASNSASFAWFGQFKNWLTARNQVRFVQRVGKQVYPVWDLAVSSTGGRVRPFLQFSNLSNTGYVEIPGVAMPGRTIVGGFELRIPLRERHE